MDQKQTQGQQKQGQDAPQSGQQNWNERQTPGPNRDQGDGSGETPGSGRPDSNTERGGTDRDRTRNSETGGITNRDLDSEMDEQEELPDRGNRQSER